MTQPHLYLTKLITMEITNISQFIILYIIPVALSWYLGYKELKRKDVNPNTDEESNVIFFFVAAIVVGIIPIINILVLTIFNLFKLGTYLRRK